jgi:pilus assembly protein CpaB
MSDHSNDSRQVGGSFFSGVLTGGIFGFILAACVVGLIANQYMKRKTAGWNLVPVVVAAQDIPENTAVTFDMISQRSVPEQFVTSSVVKPDSASYIVNQPLLVPVQAGDMLLWSQFETKKMTTVLFAARDIAVGAKLSAEDVEGRKLEPAFPTSNYAKEPERAQLLGKTVSTAFRKGDPILLSHFQDAPAPTADAKAQ